MNIFGQMMGTAMGTALSAAKAAEKSKQSGSGAQSSGYVPHGSNTDSQISTVGGQADYDAIAQAKKDYETAAQNNDQLGMDKAHNAAEEIRNKYDYSGGGDGSEYLTSGSRDVSQEAGVIDTIRDAQAQREAELAEAARQQRAAQEAAIEQSVYNLNAQKGGVQTAGADGNRAAEAAYYDIIDPNGANAEAMAARGLSGSGIAESSMISAGNTRQEALNANVRSVNEQLSAIDRQIENARMTGDIATAQMLASYRQAVAESAYQNAQSIAQLKMDAYRNAQSNDLTEAGLTGFYRGKTTLAGEESATSKTYNEMVNKRYQEELRILLATGMDAAQADLQAQRLANEYQQMVNRNDTSKVFK